jgi:hypothetical protein
MLTIELRINGELIGGAKVTNTSNLAELSDYQVLAVEAASAETGLPDMRQEFVVLKHRRNQSVFALVEEVARRAQLDPKEVSP